MSSNTDRPTLNPSFCFNQTAVQDFLRLSRAAVDDTISQNLNALLAPGSVPFDPSSTSARQSAPRTRRLVSGVACESFRNQVLFPAWQTRSDVMNYCAGVATSPDPDDPEHVLRETEDTRARERIIDERLDPYSARYFPREVRTESLASLVRNERMVENIVRERTWGIVRERCEAPADGSVETNYDKALNDWRTGGTGTKR